MSAKTWRQIALKHIGQKYAEIKIAEPELSPEDILKRISKDHYPFGERAMHPYKAWLSAM